MPTSYIIDEHLTHTEYMIKHLPATHQSQESILRICESWQSLPDQSCKMPLLRRHRGAHLCQYTAHGRDICEVVILLDGYKVYREAAGHAPKKFQNTENDIWRECGDC